jgi:hypothetical protein
VNSNEPGGLWFLETPKLGGFSDEPETFGFDPFKNAGWIHPNRTPAGFQWFYRLAAPDGTPKATDPRGLFLHCRDALVANLSKSRETVPARLVLHFAVNNGIME